jgi:lysophospholipase L1-like esterase
MIHQRDRRPEPVKRMIALGESTTWGYSVSNKQLCWVSRLHETLESFQGSPIEVINQAIGSNVITPKCPVWEHSRTPAAIDRLDEDVIEHNPDLLLLSYGLNDSRGGTSLSDFREAYDQLIERVRAKIDPTIVILTTYFIREEKFHKQHWDKSNYEVTMQFNDVIHQIARDHDLILADVWRTECGVDWIIDLDSVHPNDLGHFMIANCVFEAIARNCSFVARQMPTQTLIKQFLDTYGPGPELPSPKHRYYKPAGDPGVMNPDGTLR